MKTCPRPMSLVVFRPRSGVLKYYERNARYMKVKPLRPGDVGVVRGESLPEIPGERHIVVEVKRTGRLHEIDCADLVAKGRGRR